MANTEDLTRDAWESLGIAFVFNQSGTKNADPEKTLIQSLKELADDRKTLSLIQGWLREFGPLVHIERLKALANDLTASELAWLGGLAAHQAETGDARWKAIVRYIEDDKLGTPRPHFPSSKLDELQIQRKGIDKHFARFGLRIPILEAAEAKKFKPTASAIKENIWLRMRALFGTNWRADTAVVLIQGLAKNAYQVERILGCSRETAYRNWKSLIDADAAGLFKGAGL